MTNVAVLGISGRVGRCLVRAIRESPDFVLTGALASPSSATLGRDAGEVAQSGPVAVPITADRAQALAKAEVAIDFTLPDALPENLAAVEMAAIPLVVGITGLDAARQGCSAVSASVRQFSSRPTCRSP
jgi:4-hydroxy-tetrahydrodipicolinate reductase